MSVNLNSLKEQEDALDQSIALNKIVLTMLESKKKEDFWLRIIVIISLIANIVIAGMFLCYESQWTTQTQDVTTTTVEQDTGEGSGNNVYQAGENADYIQEYPEEDVNGETNSNSDQNSNSNQE